MTTKNSGYKPPTVEPIKESIVEDPGSRDKTRHDHPAFAQVSVSRVQNGSSNALYGSALEDHHTTIRIRICRSYMIHALARDWYHGADELIEVELSAAQYAEMLTSHNIGSGVPCTLRYVNREEVPRLPAKPTTEAGRVTQGFAEKMKTLRKSLQPRAASIMKLAEKLSAKAREELRIDLQVILQEIDSNIPFVLDSFNEATTKIVSAAKHEIEAFTMHGIMRAGLKALGIAGQQEPERKQLAMIARCGASFERDHGGMTSTHYCGLDVGHNGEHAIKAFA